MLFYGASTALIITTIISAALTLRPVKLFALYFILPFIAIYVMGDLLRPSQLSESVNTGFIGKIVADIKMTALPNFSVFIKELLLSFTVSSILLGVFNMMPIFPLDGGHIAKRLAEEKLNKEKLPYKIFFIYVPCLLVLLMLLPVIGDIKKMILFLF